MANLELAAYPLNKTWTPDANLGLASPTHQQVAAGLDALPQAERIVLSLLYFEELTVPETAAIMSRPEVEIFHLHDRAMLCLGLWEYEE